MVQIEKIHIVPSGSDKSLCGLPKEEIDGTSLGMLSNCYKCNKIANELLSKN